MLRLTDAQIEKSILNFIDQNNIEDAVLTILYKRGPDNVMSNKAILAKTNYYLTQKGKNHLQLQEIESILDALMQKGFIDREEIKLHN